MARPDLSCDRYIPADNSTIYFIDDTDNYGAGTILTSTVTTFQIVHHYESLGVDITYNFTVSSNTITAASMVDAEGTTINILADLSSTTFPFTSSNKFDLRDTDYGAELPEMEDGLMSFDYTINGTSGSAYSYTTSVDFITTGDLCCCIAEKYIEAAECGCDDKMAQVNEIEFWFNAAIYAVNIGETTKGLEYFEKAQDLCEAECDC